MSESQSSLQQVEKAVIPAAGLGSRMLPITKSVPKEMLPVGHKPMIQHVVEEAAASGIKQVCVVIREGKEIIKNYFSLKEPFGAKRDESIAELEALTVACELTFVFQKQPLGLGDALLQARHFVGTQPFVMMIPDQLMSGGTPATSQLLKHWRPGATIWSSLLRLSKKERPYFVGARGVEYEERGTGEVAISRLRTEEETRRAHVDLQHEVRGFGRTIFPPEIFAYLGQDFANPETGEVDLLKTFAKCTQEVEVVGIWLEGEPFDLGSFQSYYRYLPKLWEFEQERAARNALQT
ncbi:MAG TPA: sugar phosphate nucleotidyltransferase [Pyrinomonadaceae bacterium]|jgi:UTP--glucose-1-phosphate uridylyltransferase